MHQLVPTFILNHYKAGTLSGRFQAVGLFVDTSGFTAMTDALMAHGQHGAEVLAEVIHATFSPLMAAVFERGGFITTQEGDAFTAQFPLDGGQGDAARRALSAAIQIQALAAGLASHATPYGVFTIQVKVGLGAGETAWAIIPSNTGKRAAYYFRGTAISAPAEAEGLAKPGEIMMDQEFYALVQGVVKMDRVDNFWRLVEAMPADIQDIQLQGILTQGILPQDSQAMDLELASQFFPRDLFGWKAAGEFRQVAYLFVSLPTIRTETQLALFMQTLFKLQDRYGGLLSRVGFGDKGPHLMLFWGAPTAHENDLERLFNFILELQTQTAIPINGGVTYRISHTGFIGCDLAEDFSPFGRGPNLAARFMTSAPRGEIWVDEFAAARASPHFNLDYAGEQVFKGFAQPQKVFKLVDRKDAPESPSTVRLVGREAELTALDEFIRPIFSGACPGVLAMWGEPGMGKTSLVYEAMRRLTASAPDPYQLFVGQSDEILRQPFNPFRYWLQRYFQVSDAQGENRNKRSFNHKVDELIGLTADSGLADELDRTRSFLGAMVDLYWPDSLYEQLDAKGRYENIILGLAAILQAESRRQPVVFLLEDAHWLDDDSQAFLPRLMRMMAEGGQSFPFAMLITSRLEGTELPLEEIPNRQLYLDRLSPPTLADLAAATLGGPVASDLLELLEERGEGNPFFTEQLLHYLNEEALLVNQDGGWNVIPGREFSLPPDVGSLLVARLDRLSGEVKEVVQTASILGHEFELVLLTEMLKNQSTVFERVSAAEKEKIWSVLNEIRYIFKHVLLRDAAYQMQVHSQRQALHQLAFEALEKVYPDHPRHLYGEFAYHAEQGGLTEPARYYLEQAGKAAQEGYLNKLAEAYYSRALGLTPGDDDEKRFDLLIARELTYEMQGMNELRWRDLEELELLSGKTGSSAKTLDVLLRKSWYFYNLGNYAEAVKLARQAVEQAALSGRTDKAVTAYVYLATANLYQNQFDLTATWAETGLALAEKAGSQHEACLLINILGLNLVEQNKLDLGKRMFERGLQVIQQGGRLDDQGPILNNLGLVAGRQGNSMAALGYFEEALKIARKVGDRKREALVLGNIGWHAGSIGEYSRARGYTAQNIRIAREAGDRRTEAYGLINLSSHEIAVEDYAAAAGSATLGRDLAIKMGDRSCEAWALTNLGHAQVGSGDTKKAREAYSAALAIRKELEQPVIALEPMAGLAWAMAQEHEMDAAGGLLETILSYLASGDLEGTDDPLRVYLTTYRILRAIADPRAGEILARGYQFLQHRAGNINDPASWRMFLENIPSHRDLRAAWNEQNYQSEQARSSR